MQTLSLTLHFQDNQPFFGLKKCSEKEEVKEEKTESDDDKMFGSDLTHLTSIMKFNLGTFLSLGIYRSSS